jgi:hypothetical protein
MKFTGYSPEVKPWTASSSAVQVAALSSVRSSVSIRLILELFKRRLQLSKNISVEFDDVLPFYKPTSGDQPTDDADELTDANTTFALPSKSSVEKLVQAFFKDWHPLFPVLHRPSFQWDFDAMYTEKASKDPAHLAQMWLVLAIAARDSTASNVWIRFFWR